MLFLILLFLNGSSAKIFSNVEEINGNNVNEIESVSVHSIVDSRFDSGGDGNVIDEPLWVIHLNKAGWMDLELQLGTSEDQEDFYTAVAPMIRESDIRQTATTVFNKNVKQQSNAQLPSSSKHIQPYDEFKHDVIRLINKVAITTSTDPDTYLSVNDNEKDPSIALYFKGQFSCLIVILDDKQWHYILETSPFPSWFYETHDTQEAPIKIPENIRHMFFQVLLRFLKLILSHPL